MAGYLCFAQSPNDTAVYLPIMSGVSERDEGGFQVDYVPRGLFESESG